jgi:hypothetical protein
LAAIPNNVAAPYGAPGDPGNEAETAMGVFQRIEEKYYRGHIDYMLHARRMEDMYLAGGRQWRADDAAKLEQEGRPAYEVDIIKPAINAIIGYQIANRVDLSFVPRGGDSDENSARIMSKVVRQMLDNVKWRQIETNCVLDGLIQQRGYLDLRMSYDNNDLGELEIRCIDPLDAMPDLDANEYDPDKWADFDESRWLTATQIESQYGKDAADQIVGFSDHLSDEENWGVENGVDRRGFDDYFGAYAYGRAYYGRKGPWRRYRIVHRQVNEYASTLVARWPTGDVRSLTGSSREEIGYLLQKGIPVFKRRMRQVRMMVAAPGTMLFDGRSPYKHMTPVPFFPYFRRGRTIGAVDALASVQEMLNKFISQYGHVINSSANGGWEGEADSLANMDDGEFVDRASETGLVLLTKPGKKAPTKIKPNDVPQGIAEMIQFAYKNAQMVSGVDENLMGANQKDLSGVAVQSYQYASQMKLAPMLDNVSLMRQTMLGRVLDITQEYMGAERVMRISEENSYGAQQHIPYTLNQRMDDGSVLNDLTIGTYDLVVDEQPAQITFDNSQFEQMETMRKMGIPISDARMIRASNLSNKSEIAEEAEQKANTAANMSAQPNPLADASIALAQAKAALAQAQARKAQAEAVEAAIESEFSAVQTAQTIVMTPAVATLADQLLKSGGFVDADAPPIVPQVPPGTQMTPAQEAEIAGQHKNTHPLFPAHADTGLNKGISKPADPTAVPVGAPQPPGSVHNPDDGISSF